MLSIVCGNAVYEVSYPYWASVYPGSQGEKDNDRHFHKAPKYMTVNTARSFSTCGAGCSLSNNKWVPWDYSPTAIFHTAHSDTTLLLTTPSQCLGPMFVSELYLIYSLSTQLSRFPFILQLVGSYKINHWQSLSISSGDHILHPRFGLRHQF